MQNVSFCYGDSHRNDAYFDIIPRKNEGGIDPQEFSANTAIATCPSCGSGQQNLALSLAEVFTRLPYTRLTSRLVDLAILATEEECGDE